MAQLRDDTHRFLCLISVIDEIQAGGDEVISSDYVELAKGSKHFSHIHNPQVYARISLRTERLRNQILQHASRRFQTLALFSVILGAIFASGTSIPVQADGILRTWTVNKQGQLYHLQYYIINESKVQHMDMGGYDNKSLIISINSTSSDTLTVRIPRPMLDYNPPAEGQSAKGYSHFSVFIDGTGSPFDEVETGPEFRTLKIDFQVGTKTIQISEIPYLGLPDADVTLDRVYNLTIENQAYPIKYGFSDGSAAVVDSMRASVESKSITVTITDNSAGAGKKTFLIELPREIIDANTTNPGIGCSYSNPTNNTFWFRENDLPYKITIVSMTGDNATTTIYEGDAPSESCSRDTRTLSIEYPGGKSMISIQGTVIVPEFAFLTGWTLICATTGAVGVLRLLLGRKM